MRKVLKFTVLAMSLPFIVVATYLFVALIGSVIPASMNKNTQAEPTIAEPIYLLGTLLHTDIAVPINAISLSKFKFLAEAGIPLDHPDLKYLVIGWGSKSFYTQTADYSDITISTAFKAITGDSSVMHVAPSRDVSNIAGVQKLKMSETDFVAMLDFILQGFTLEENAPVLLPDTFGFGDVFYEGTGDFNIFNPCNVWVSRALQAGGRRAGIWTPTSYGLKLANWLHN